jgi:glutaredoxin 3
MDEVIVYTMRGCQLCRLAKELLASKGIPFREVVVPEDDDRQWELLEKKSGMKTMPQIFYGERLIGGYTELVALDRDGRLESLKTVI